MKTLSNSLAFLLVSTCSAIAIAQPAGRSSSTVDGPYIGGNIGAFGARPSGISLTKSTTAAKNGFGFKLYTGYQLDQNFGAEAGFVRSSDLKRSFLVNGTSIQQVGKVNALYLAGTTRLPLNEQLAVVAKLGLARGKFSGTNVLPSSSAIIGSKTSLIASAGAEYKFSPTISGTFDFDYLPKTSERLKTSLISAGFKVAF
jgi:OmpA-OmpF porin, OOP family